MGSKRGQKSGFPIVPTSEKIVRFSAIFYVNIQHVITINLRFTDMVSRIRTPSFHRPQERFLISEIYFF